MKKLATFVSAAGAMALFSLCFVTPAAAQPRQMMMGGWENLGGQAGAPVECVHSGYGRIDCVARDADGALRHLWRNRDGPWSGWQDLGGRSTHTPECVVWNNRRFDCFVRGTDGALWRRTFQATQWTAWQNLGGFIAAEAGDVPISCTFRSARSGDSATGRDPHLIDCFVRGSDGALWRRALDGEVWAAWENLGGVLTTPPDCVAAGLRLHCFARGTDNALWRRAFDGAAWGAWESLGGVLTSGVDCTARDGQRIDCFVRGTDGAIWRRAWAGSAWRDWQHVGGAPAPGGFNCMTTPTGALQCYAIFDGVLQRRVLSGSTWQAWEQVGGGVTGRPACVGVDSRRIDCFATAANGALQHRWWTGSAWQPARPAQTLESSP